MKERKFRPVADKILVRIEKAPDKVGSIFIPENAKERPQKGEVLAVGPGRFRDDGTIHPMTIKVGQTVVFSSYAGSKYPGNDELLIMREDDLMGVEE